MDEPQIIRTPSGDELVVLSRQEYEALRTALAEAEEELEDIAILDQRKAELANHPAPYLPADVSMLMLQGHRRLAAFRTWRSLSKETLATNAAIAPAELERLEAGNGVEDPAVAQRLAKALDIHVSWIEA